VVKCLLKCGLLYINLLIVCFFLGRINFWPSHQSAVAGSFTTLTRYHNHTTLPYNHITVLYHATITTLTQLHHHIAITTLHDNHTAIVTLTTLLSPHYHHHTSGLPEYYTITTPRLSLHQTTITTLPDYRHHTTILPSPHYQTTVTKLPDYRHQTTPLPSPHYQTTITTLPDSHTSGAISNYPNLSLYDAKFLSLEHLGNIYCSVFATF